MAPSSSSSSSSTSTSNSDSNSSSSNSHSNKDAPVAKGTTSSGPVGKPSGLQALVSRYNGGPVEAPPYPGAIMGMTYATRGAVAGATLMAATAAWGRPAGEHFYLGTLPRRALAGTGLGVGLASMATVGLAMWMTPEEVAANGWSLWQSERERVFHVIAQACAFGGAGAGLVIIPAPVGTRVGRGLAVGLAIAGLATAGMLGADFVSSLASKKN